MLRSQVKEYLIFRNKTKQIISIPRVSVQNDHNVTSLSDYRYSASCHRALPLISIQYISFALLRTESSLYNCQLVLIVSSLGRHMRRRCLKDVPFYRAKT